MKIRCTWAWKTLWKISRIQEPISKLVSQITRLFCGHYFVDLLQREVQWAEGACSPGND